MTADPELAAELERSLEHLPPVRATLYLRAARRARRRRQVVSGVVVASVLALGVGVAVTSGHRQPDPSGVDVAGSGSVGHPPVVGPGELGPDPDYVAPEPANPVEAVDGLAGVDYFSTTGIPNWAQEYGNHGPVAIAPDGRLWVAPDAAVLRTVVDPVHPGAVDADGRPTSYAVEAAFDNPGMRGHVVWVIVGDGADEMDQPGRWTDDFELWVDDVTAELQGRPSFAERLVHVGDDGSAALVLAAGVELVDQVEVTAVLAAADVRWAGKTWYVIAQRPRAGDPWSEAYDPTGSRPGSKSFTAFVDWVRENR